MVVCDKGGEVFMVPTQWGQSKPKQPTPKDPREKSQQRNVAYSVARGSHGHGCAGIP